MSPLARPLALSTAPRSPRSKADSSTLSPATHTPEPSSVSAAAGRITDRRLEQIARDLLDLDRDVLLFVQSLRLVTGNQLRRRFWPEDESAGRAARRALARLVKWRVLDRIEGRRGGVRAGSEGYIYVVGSGGHRLLSRLGFEGRRTGVPGERYISHALAISETVVLLHEADGTGALEVIEVQTEPACWRPFLGLMGARVALKPDLYLRLGAGRVDEDRWFVEIDMATEGAGSLAAKFKRYGQHFRSGEEQRREGVYPRVIWAVPNVRRAEVVNRVLDRLDAETKRLHVVTTQAALVPLLTSEARA
jgi:Replication-relaxation